MSDAIQVVMLDVLKDDFEAWLATRGLMLGKLPEHELREDALPTYIVAPVSMR